MLATSGNAGWGRDSWSRRSSFAGSRDTNRSQPSSRNWKRWRRLSRGLSNRERRRRVGYAGVATFHGAPGVSSPWTIADYFHLVLWNLAVLAFYSLLRVSVDPADELQSWYYARRTKAIELARQTGDEVFALLEQPAESMLVELQIVNQKLAQVTAHLGPPSHEELLQIAMKMQAK